MSPPCAPRRGSDLDRESPGQTHAAAGTGRTPGASDTTAVLVGPRTSHYTLSSPPLTVPFFILPHYILSGHPFSTPPFCTFLRPLTPPF